ncbi:unnamed protein product [Calypogeia fissa]
MKENLVTSAMNPRELAASTAVNCHPYDREKETEEDAHHWESLTDDLHVMVLNKVPFFSLMRFRTVCKKWNSVILSREITPVGTKFTPKTVPIYFSHGPLILFDSRKNMWQEQSLDFIQYPRHTLSLLVSAGGLLCFKTSITGELMVCNPTSMRSRYLTLPRGFDSHSITDPLPDLSKPVVTLDGGKEAIEAFQRSCGKEVVVGLLTERHKQWYKLVIAGISNGSRRTTLVYDSFMHQWQEGSAVPQGARFWESGKNVNLNGYLYCITFTAGIPSGESDLDWPWSVVKYDSANDVWTEIRLRTRGSILPQLVEHRGRILVIQRNGKAEDEISFS